MSTLTPKVGDEYYVLIYGWGTPGLKGPWTVTKVTATQMTLSDGTRWVLRYGRRLGAGDWNREYAVPADSPKVADVKQSIAHVDAERALLAEMSAWTAGKGTIGAVIAAATAYREKYGEVRE